MQHIIKTLLIYIDIHSELMLRVNEEGRGQEENPIRTYAKKPGFYEKSLVL
jgi:hypothetical protein